MDQLYATRGQDFSAQIAWTPSSAISDSLNVDASIGRSDYMLPVPSQLIFVPSLNNLPSYYSILLNESAENTLNWLEGSSRLWVRVIDGINYSVIYSTTILVDVAGINFQKSLLPNATIQEILVSQSDFSWASTNW